MTWNLDNTNGNRNQLTSYINNKMNGLIILNANQTTHQRNECGKKKSEHDVSLQLGVYTSVKASFN